jgi:hypothetical protein
VVHRQAVGIVRAYRRWRVHRLSLRLARYETELAEQRAKTHLAAYKVKSNIEWDIKWMSPLDKSWRGELIVIVWAFPVLALFLPETRPWALSFFARLKDFSPDAPTFYIEGWLFLFAATFGVKGITSMLPSRYSRLVTAMGGVPDDVPPVAAEAAQAAVTPDDPGIDQ